MYSSIVLMRETVTGPSFFSSSNMMAGRTPIDTSVPFRMDRRCQSGGCEMYCSNATVCSTSAGNRRERMDSWVHRAKTSRVDGLPGMYSTVRGRGLWDSALFGGRSTRRWRSTGGLGLCKGLVRRWSSRCRQLI
jgi:hypothetical protein